ncbi:MAG TPA: SRPBCC family protein, partial [Candidatus Limnocylindria bacterium]
VVRELMGQRLSVDVTVTAYDRGRRLALTSAVSGIQIDAVLELEPANTGTLARFGMDIRAQNVFMKPMEGMVAGAASSDLATSLDRLRAALEGK